MTFYEAALRVLETEGRPLTFQEITDRSIQQNLLSHIGKTPELTMLSRLLAMARRKTDRKVVVTAKDTFALVDWGLPEGPDALAETAKSELREEENLPPLRPPERHPEPRAENVRIAGRGAERKRRHEEEDRGRRKKKFPPIAEVVFDLLSDAGVSLKPQQLAERARERELAGTDLTDEAILTALLEDNQRRIDAGRRPQFILEAANGELSLERAGAPSEVTPAALQAAFAAALGIPMEGGRPALARPAAAIEGIGDIQTAITALKTAAREAKRTTARALRKRLSDLDTGSFEKAMVKVLHALGFRELKAAKRSKEGPLFTARKREGSLELRFAIRLLKGAATVDRKSVQELRRDLGHYAAQVGLIATAGDVRGDARTEATSSGSLVFLWAGEALAEKFFEAEAGVTVTRFEAYEIDERFFDVAKVEAEEAQRRREERTREKAEREERRPERPTPGEAPRPAAVELGGEAEVAAVEEGAEPAPAPEGAPVPAELEAVSAPAEVSEAPVGEEEGEEGEEEGDEELERAEGTEGAASGAPEQPAGERRRRRRRRRGRRGRGNKPGEGAAAQAGPPGTPPPEDGRPAANIVPAPVAPAEPAREAAPPPPPPAPSNGGGEGNAG